MWELIRANQRKSIFLFIGMAICLMLLGYLLGVAFFPPDGGIMGLFAASGLWLLMTMFSLISADSVLLAVSHAQPITQDIHPQLFNVTDEMRIAAGLSKMPQLYIMQENAPNAFATGVKADKSAIVVTSGLLAQMNRDELQGVIGHEMGHILNRDVQFMTLAGVLLGSITLITEIFFRGMYYSSGSSRRYSSRSSSSKSEGGVQLVLIIVAVVFAILAPVLAQMFYFALSRRREYLADATSARLTRYPEGLASALEKLAASTENLTVANKVTAPMYIVNPLKPEGMPLSDLTSTHPPLHERIRILRNMMGAGYMEYERAYQQEKGKPVMPASALKSEEKVQIRPADKSVPSQTIKTQTRTAGDLFRAANGFAFVTCTCGLKFKIPPEYKDSHINCPRCQRTINIPTAEVATLGTLAAGMQKAQEVVHSSSAMEGPQIFQRKTNGWESVLCQCGNLIQVSPMFVGTSMHCPKCKRIIEIRSS